MLSNPKKITSAKQASNYYKKADYYTKGEDGVDISSMWMGKGAEELGLEGAVDHKMFEAIMAGVLPDGTVLDHPNRVIGWDLTFSAPKSFSVMALAGGDLRLMGALNRAMNSVIKFAEDEFAVTRKTEDGNTFMEKTGNFLVAGFTHTTSRALDPNAHVHALVMNVTKNQEGEMRAIESNPLYDNRILLGQAFQNELERESKLLGYETSRNDRTGQFELVAVPQNVKDEFSTRRKDIVETAQTQGVSLDDAKAMEQVALNTRDTKRNVPSHTVIANWDKRIDALEFDPKTIIDEAKSNAIVKDISPQLDPENVIRLAIENLSFKESVFGRQALIKETFRFDRAKIVSLSAIGDHIDNLTKNGELVETRKDEIGQKNQIAYTTPASIDREKEILGLVKNGEGKSQALGTHEEVKNFIERYNDSVERPLNESQQVALTGIATNTDQFQGLQGLPGVGKSTMMHSLNAFANEQGHKLIGLAPTGTAAQELYHKANMETRTIDSLLEIDKHKDKDGYLYEPNTMFVVDEAGMVSDRHTVALMRLTNIAGSRMLDSGDTNQLPAIEAGNPFEKKQNLSYSFEIMNDVKRQQNPLLKEAVYASIDNSISQAFDILKQSPDHHTGITNIADDGTRVSAAVELYKDLLSNELKAGKSLNEAVREGVKVGVPVNKTKDAVNDAVREHLLSEQLIDKTKTMNLLTLTSKGLSPTEQQQAIDFKPFTDNGREANGDVIRFHADIESLGVKQGDYYRVASVATGKEPVLTLQNVERGHKTIINMNEHKDEHLMSVFTASRKDISVGEQLRWKDTYQATDIKNGQSLEVTAIDHDAKSYSVNVDDGRQVTIPMDITGSHTNYNYAITTHEFQGGSTDHLIALYGPESKRLQTRNNVLVMLSRAIKGAHIFSHDANEVAKNADEKNQTKTSALDHIGQSGVYSKVESPEFKENVLAAKDGVEKAVGHLSMQFSSFRTYEIMRHAMRFSGQSTLEVKHAISELREDKKLLEVQTNDKNETYFTTPTIVEQEKTLRGALKASAAPLNVSERKLSSIPGKFGLSDDSANVLRRSLTNAHELTIINARPNSETTLFTQALLESAKAAKTKVALISPTNQEQHAERLGKEVMTIPQYAKSRDKFGLVIVLDAHNTSAKAYNRVLSKTGTDNGRAISMGLTSLSQDFAHKDALSNLASHANKKSQLYSLTSNSQYQADVMLKQIEGNIPTATKQQLERNAKVIQSESLRHEAIVSEYLKNPDSTNIISGSKEGGVNITNKVRNELKSKGEIRGAASYDTLAPVFLSAAQKQVATEYRIGQVMFFKREGERNGFSRQETYVVVKINAQSNTVVLESSQGKKTVSIHELNPNGFSVNERTQTEIGKGDKLRFTTGVFAEKIPKNATAKVIDTQNQNNKVTVELDSGRKVELDMKIRANQFLSHGYTQAMNSSSSMPMNKNALIELDGRFKSAANVQNFLKGVSSVSRSISLFSDKRSTVSNYLNPSLDKQRSIDALLNREVQKTTAQSKAKEHQNQHEQTTKQNQTQHVNVQHEHQRTQQRER